MLPQEFLIRMQSQLGAEYPAYLQSLERPRAVALRFNPRKCREVNLPFVGEQVPWEKLGYYYDAAARPGLHPYHDAGVYYLQEASAMAPVALLAPQPGERVLDLCAAPGGKSTQIASYMAGKGFLLCNEINPTRAKVLSRNIERMGVANALVTNETPQRLAARFPGWFDRVLIDAPCSGEGMFRKEEAAVTDWSEQTVAMCARRQAEILDAGARMVRAGGRLVYSTCTFAPQEDELAVAAFLERHPDFVPEEVCAPWFCAGENGSFRLWPHKLLGEGHFAAVLRRLDGDTEQIPYEPVAEKPKQLQDFLHSIDAALPEGCLYQFAQSFYAMPDQMPQLRGLKVLRPGLELGQLRPGRFEPAHALALWLNNAGYTQDFPWDSREIAAYLHGDTLPSAQKGWCLVTVDGYSLGWAKGDGNALKNHYPKGLRR